MIQKRPVHGLFKNAWVRASKCGTVNTDRSRRRASRLKSTALSRFEQLEPRAVMAAFASLDTINAKTRRGSRS